MRIAIAAALLTLGTATTALAQSTLLPPVVFDARLVYPMMGQDATTATSLGFPQQALPAHGLGYGGGIHVYPVRGKLYSLGVGGEYVFVRAIAQQTDPTTGKPVGQQLTRRLQGLSGILSINFGRGEGWSYLSGGMGPLVFDNFYSTLQRDAPRQMTLNWGGGARWFNTDHLAFSMDLRFYMTKDAKATTNTAARAARKVFIISGGVGIK